MISSHFHPYFQDPLFNAIYTHQIKWGDVPFTPEEEKLRQEWLQEPEQIQLQLNIQSELRKISSDTVRTIIARNLPRNISTSELYTLFENFGPIEHIIIPYHLNPLHPYYGTMKGYAFIKFICPDDALQATFSQNSQPSHLILYHKIVTLELAKQDK